jgi:vancomycin permeability regulator SanA
LTGSRRSGKVRAMRRFIMFLVKLAVAALCFVAITVLLVIFDGLNDKGDSADVALVIGRDDGNNDPQLERAGRLYKDGEFHHIIVCVPNSFPAFNAQAAMTRYLEDHHVPSSAIIEDSGAEDSAVMARDVEQLMSQHTMVSVMIIADYYRMSRIKFALLHAGVSSIAKSHVGSVSFEDTAPIAREVWAIYTFFFRTFIMPAADKIKQEASTAADKASQEAGKAKDTVNQKLDTLPK